LIGDGFEEGFIGRLGVVDLRIEGNGFLDEAGDARVALGEMSDGGGKVEGERGRLTSHGDSTFSLREENGKSEEGLPQRHRDRKRQETGLNQE